MLRLPPLLLALALVLGACGRQGLPSSGADERDQIRVVGSSTVYPFTAAVAEQLARKNPDLKAPVVESTGTGGGFKLFCGGTGARFPDIADASRRITQAELAECRRNGVVQVIEVQIGIDGIVVGESRSGPHLALTPAILYKALAATRSGRLNTAATWADVDPSLPKTAITVYGPPPTSGTRDAFGALILKRGCEGDPAIRMPDETRHETLCTRVREDGAYIEAGEDDNLIVQKLSSNSDALGIFGFSMLDENGASLRGVPLNGIVPTAQTIADGSYPGARPLFLYVKSARLRVVPGLRPFLAEYAAAWNPGGYLARRGLIPAAAAVRTHNARIVADLTPLDPATIR